VDRLVSLLTIDVATLTDEQLVAHLQALRAAAAEGRAAGNLTGESVALLKAAVDVTRQIEAEFASRQVDAAQLEADADAALAKLDVSRAPAQRRPLVRSLTVPQRYRPRMSRGMSRPTMIVASGSPDGSARYSDAVELGVDAAESRGPDTSDSRPPTVNAPTSRRSTGTTHTVRTRRPYAPPRVRTTTVPRYNAPRRNTSPECGTTVRCASQAVV